MPEQKMIPCPECRGTGEVTCIMSGEPEVEEVIVCYQCDGEKTIPDRRAPSAAERAVERIKAFIDGRPRTAYKDYGNGMLDTMNEVERIIDEEASRDQ